MSALAERAAQRGATALAGGGAFHFGGGWTPEAAAELLSTVTSAALSSNVIEMHAEGPRSNDSVPLSLHQEDYHLEQRPRILALLCIDIDTIGGGTLVSPMDPSILPDELRDEQIRYYRHSVQEWTPWRPVVETIDGLEWPRITTPDLHRTVEVSAHADVFDAFVRRVEAAQQEVDWSPGTLLVVDNRIAVHGRSAVSGRRRKLVRWVG